MDNNQLINKDGVFLTGRICQWCGIAEIDKNSLSGFQAWLGQPRGCCAPDGDGHSWRPLYEHEREKYEKVSNETAAALCAMADDPYQPELHKHDDTDYLACDASPRKWETHTAFVSGGEVCEF